MAEQLLNVNPEAIFFSIHDGASKILNMKRSSELLGGAFLMGVALVVSCSLLSGTAFGQQLELTPEQMQLLEQVPANYRKQALDAIRRHQNATRQSTADDDSGVTSQDALFQPRLDETEDDEPEELRGEPNSRLIIEISTPIEVVKELLEEIEENPVLLGLVGSQYYVLDENGVLDLPGLAEIPLLGLDAFEMAERISTVRDLSKLIVNVMILNEEPFGAAALKPFGYELFESEDVSLIPSLTGPVPPDYLLGPGDIVQVQFFGNETGTYELEISRDGTLNVPELGSMVVAGLHYSDFKNELADRVRNTLIGTQVSASVGELKSMLVFVLGDVNRPGSYHVGGLATMSSALYRSGGISLVGSLRNVQLKRSGKLISTLDLYDLLLSGDTSNDARLQPGDVLFVPPVGAAVGIGGAVNRPAIYEIRGESSVADVVKLAGGLKPSASLEDAVLERINADRSRVVLTIDIGSETGSRTRVSAGDLLMIPEVLSELVNTIFLSGEVERPGPYQWAPGMRLTDVIPTIRYLSPGADTSYVLVRRVNPTNRRISIESANLEAALSDLDSKENIDLRPNDTIYIFSLAYGRQRIIEPIMEELKLQSRLGDAYEEVEIRGGVRAPGVYPLENNMRVRDLIEAGGDLDESAYVLGAELTRFTVDAGLRRQKEIITIDLKNIDDPDSSTNMYLQAHDQLHVKGIPGWNSDWVVAVEGEVLFPGEYQIIRGETLTQLIKRVGGFTDRAFPEGAIFLRESLKEREKKQMDLLASRMEADLASLSLQSLDSRGVEAINVGDTLISQLRDFEPVGRLVLNIDQLIGSAQTGDPIGDIELKDGDQVLVPSRTQEVTIIGEVQYPSSHVFQKGLARDDYIAMSGGTTRKADKKLIYVVKASGVVDASSGSRWFGKTANLDIRPGDTIVVPLDTDRIRPLSFWTQVTQILYQSAIAIAAVNSF